MSDSKFAELQNPGSQVNVSLDNSKPIKKQPKVFVGLLFVISIIAAFFIGKYVSVTTTLAELRTNVQSLETALVKQGVVTPHAESDLKATLAQADDFLKKDDWSTAGLYFSNVINQTPHDWGVISHYQQSFLQYCQQQIKQGKQSLALNLLTDMEAFLRMQAIRINRQDLEKLQKALTEIAQMRKTTEEAMLGQQTIPTQSSNPLVQQAAKFIEKAKNEPLKSDFVLYYLNAANSVIQQLVLLESEGQNVKAEVAKLSTQLEVAKGEIAEKQSKEAWIEISTEIEKYKSAKYTKKQDGIDHLVKIRQLIADKSSQLSSPKFLEKIQPELENVGKQFAELQKTQQLAYEMWAINRVDAFYKQTNESVGYVKDDKEGIYNGIVANLGDIDIRYLSLPAQTAYNEAFNAFYAKLKGEQKIPLSATMTLSKKRQPSDF